MPAHKGSVSVGLFQVPNLDRTGCAEEVSSSLRGMDGVLKVGINFVTDKVYVSYDPLVLAREQVRRAIAVASSRPPGARQKKTRDSTQTHTQGTSRASGGLGNGRRS